MIVVELEAFLTADQQSGCTARAARASPDSTAEQNSCTSIQEGATGGKGSPEEVTVAAQKSDRPQRPAGCWSCGDKNQVLPQQAATTVGKQAAAKLEGLSLVTPATKRHIQHVVKTGVTKDCGKCERAEKKECLAESGYPQCSTVKTRKQLE